MSLQLNGKQSNKWQQCFSISSFYLSSLHFLIASIIQCQGILESRWTIGIYSQWRAMEQWVYFFPLYHYPILCWPKKKYLRSAELYLTSLWLSSQKVFFFGGGRYVDKIDFPAWTQQPHIQPWKQKKKLNRIFIGKETQLHGTKSTILYATSFLSFFFFFAVVGKVINQIIFSIMKEVCTKLKLKRKGFYLEFTHEIILRSKLGCEMLANVCCLFFFSGKTFEN